jgi:hypothetical protein
MRRTLDYSPCERGCDTSNAGANSGPEQPGSRPPNINSCSPSEDMAIRGVPRSAKWPTTYFYVITRRSVSSIERRRRG